MTDAGIRVATRRIPTASADALTFLHLPDTGGPRFYWSAPDEGTTLAAFGAAHVARGEGPDRLDQVGSAIRPVSSGGRDSAGFGVPKWLGGVAFDPLEASGTQWDGFPPAWFVLPAATLTQTPAGTWLTTAHADAEDRDPATTADRVAEQLAGATTAPMAAGGPRASSRPDPHRQPPLLDDSNRAALLRRIGAALAAIDRGDVAKVVAATSRTIDRGRPFDPLAILDQLRAAEPGCFHFLVSPRPGLALVGASPERLVRIDGRQLETVALAGSAPRDPDPERDRALGEALLASPKERAEHAVVVAAIRDSLNGYRLAMPMQPRLRRLAAIQHLETPISAVLPHRGDILMEAAHLHPTPALGGSPRGAALALIRALESAGRGWFGGAVGWIDAGGDGELAVVIRSVLVRGHTATAFAGAGIVAGSDPEAEVREMELKLHIVLGAIEAAG